ASALFEDRGPLEGRAASLLPGLFLARVDGKSPVEYVTDEADRERVRRVAIPLIVAPPASLGEVRKAWSRELTAWGARGFRQCADAASGIRADVRRSKPR